jgi:hypothetical protein
MVTLYISFDFMKIQLTSPIEIPLEKTVHLCIYSESTHFADEIKTCDN